MSNGRNKAFEMCTGEYIVCLDDDAVSNNKRFFCESIF
ncbi:MAG: glycosyltransferase [Ruminococcus sp.]